MPVATPGARKQAKATSHSRNAKLAARVAGRRLKSILTADPRPVARPHSPAVQPARPQSHHSATNTRNGETSVQSGHAHHRLRIELLELAQRLGREADREPHGPVF